jgi:hypothetical protein
MRIPASTAGLEATTKDTDHAMKAMLAALRKPLKLTATMKRRALKGTATAKVEIMARSRQSGL